jgi:single-stranded-DNA-specific exonuclease
MEAMDGARLDGIAFRAADTALGNLLMNSRGANLHVAGSLGAEHYQGARRIQLRVADAAPAK